MLRKSDFFELKINIQLTIPYLYEGKSSNFSNVNNYSTTFSHQHFSKRIQSYVERETMGEILKKIIVIRQMIDENNMQERNFSPSILFS